MTRRSAPKPLVRLPCRASTGGAIRRGKRTVPEETVIAVRTSEAAGITLVAAARGHDFEIFTRPDRIDHDRARNVA